MRAKMTKPMAAMAAEKRRERKSSVCSIGEGARLSKATKHASTTAPNARAPITSGDVQPRFGASMIPQSSDPMPTTESRPPAGSVFGADGFFEFGTRKQVAVNETMTMGTLTRKTEPHQKCERSQPPTTGPIATPRPEVPDQMPMARARSGGFVNTFVRIDRVEGMTPDR